MTPTPDSSLWTPQQIEQGAREVQNILTTRGLKTDFALPALAGGPTPEEKSFLQKIFDWIASHFPDLGISAGKLNPSLLQWLSIAAVVVLVGSILGLLGVLIYRAIERSKQVTLGGIGGNPRGEFLLDPEERLLKQIAAAQSAGEWPKASRLRWRLHLLRKELPVSATPKEVLNETAVWIRHYTLMFGTRTSDPAPPELYKAFEASIKNLEASADSKT